MNAATFLTKAARTNPQRTAVRYGPLLRSYREMDDRVSALAGALRAHGAEPGDRVMIFHRNAPELLESVFAAFRGGLVAVPVNNRLHPSEAAFIARDSGAKVLIFSDEFGGVADAVREAVPAIQTICTGTHPESDDFERVLAAGAPVADAEVDPTDTAWLFYTSGTTGRPKGAMISHRNLVVMTMNYYADMAPVSCDDVFLHAAPLTHGSGLYALPALAKSAENIILDTPRFDTTALLRTIEEHSVSQVAFLAPTMIAMVLENPAVETTDLSSLRCVVYGGAPMYVEDMRRAVRAFGPVLVQLYGQGEAPMTISVLGAGDHVDEGDPVRARRLASAGVARTDVEIAVFDESDEPLPPGTLGEVCVRGDIVMNGYWENPSATASTLRGGWLHTGDIGRIDEDGYLYLLDRSKDLIISGGSNIYPREIEEVLLQHPAVYEAAVFGIADRKWGETVKAVVALRPGMNATEEELVALCTANLASYKKPRSVEFVAELPKNAAGKILKRQLRDKYQVSGV